MWPAQEQMEEDKIKGKGRKGLEGRKEVGEEYLPTILEENEQQGDGGSDSSGDPRRWSFVDAS